MGETVKQGIGRDINYRDWRVVSAANKPALIVNERLDDKVPVALISAACAFGNADCVKLLLNHNTLDAKELLMCKDHTGRQPLHHAAWGGSFDAAQDLLWKAIELDGASGATGKDSLVQRLVRAKDKSKWTPLHWLADVPGTSILFDNDGHVRVAELLLKHGAPNDPAFIDAKDTDQ